jgi:transcriptional regulator of met regulon
VLLRIRKGKSSPIRPLRLKANSGHRLPTTAQLQAGKGDELRELGVGKGTGRRGVSGITYVGNYSLLCPTFNMSYSNSFLGMQVDSEGQDRGIPDDVPQER